MLDIGGNSQSDRNKSSGQSDRNQGEIESELGHGNMAELSVPGHVNKGNACTCIQP